MTVGYDEAVQALYRAPHEAFVAERKRLAAELKASGDATGAQRLSKLARPTISAWAVNQLFWHERATFQKLFESAAELRAGKLTARDAHRQAVATLSARARKLLAEGGHAVSEGTVRRVEATLAGLAAAGGFAPEPDGALTKDRDPPGFEAFGISSSGATADAAEAPEPAARAHATHATHATHAKAKPSEDAKSSQAEQKEAAVAKRREHEAAQRARAAAEAARKREAEARAKREAEQRELTSAVREAKRALAERISARERAEKVLAAAEREEREARAAVERAEAKLAALSADE